MNSAKGIQCPRSATSTDNCAWHPRKGKIRDFAEYGVEECQSCHLVSHSKDLRELVDYESGSMHSWSLGYGGILELPKEDITRRVTAIKKFSDQFKFKAILDFGSGRGEMISALSQDFEVNGLEPEAEARLLCQSKNQKIYGSMAELKVSNRKFDLVTLFHVVEHLYSPHTELSEIFSLLDVGGLVLVETPNAADALLVKYESEPFSNFTYWSHHPMLHSHQSLQDLLESVGFEVLVNTGVQRYGLANHIHWLTQGMPGGHIVLSGLFSQDTEDHYAADLVRNRNSDTIWLLAVKK